MASSKVRGSVCAVARVAHPFGRSSLEKNVFIWIPTHYLSFENTCWFSIFLNQLSECRWRFLHMRILLLNYLLFLRNVCAVVNKCENVKSCVHVYVLCPPRCVFILLSDWNRPIYRFFLLTWTSKNGKRSGKKSPRTRKVEEYYRPMER